jgi:hypothetical protein
MVTSVQARMHDPLWLLGRQWQFDELRHDAGATPIDVRVEGVVSALTKLRGGSGTPAASGSLVIETTEVPLETLVEREAVPEMELDNLRLRTEAGMHLLRMLRAADLGHQAAFWVAESPFAAPDADDATRDWFTLVNGHVPDGADCPEPSPAPRSATGTAPLDPAEAKVMHFTWCVARFDRPGSGPSTWIRSMEYAFTAGALGDGERCLWRPSTSKEG